MQVLTTIDQPTTTMNITISFTPAGTAQTGGSSTALLDACGA
jgi:hypothetical protein